MSSMGAPSDTLLTLDSGSANISVTITDDDVTVTPPVLTGLIHQRWYANANVLLQPSLLYRPRRWVWNSSYNHYRHTLSQALRSLFSGLFQ